MGVEDQWVKDTCHWTFALHDIAVVAKGILGCLLPPTHVSTQALLGDVCLITDIVQ